MKDRHIVGLLLGVLGALGLVLALFVVFAPADGRRCLRQHCETRTQIVLLPAGKGFMALPQTFTTCVCVAYEAPDAGTDAETP